jgi:hypothetical protein
MVDWDRVEELRSKGWDWSKIAADPKVGFHPDASVQQPGRALRALYHRRRSRQERAPSAEAAPTKKDQELKERKWTLARVGYLVTPLVGIWFVLAYFYPSPLGLVLMALPWLALGLAIAAFVLFFGLWRSSGARWSPLFRTTVIYGVVLGLVVTGAIALVGYALGCPFLPSGLGNEAGPGWGKASVSPWQEGGLPVFYFYGATWCPYCSASSWAMWKALTEFQTGFPGTVYGIPGTVFQYSDPTDQAGPSTPEVVLANLAVNSPALSYQVSEYMWNSTTGTTGTFPSTSNCIQSAYVTAYSGSSIPFLVINGQYVHGGSSLILPSQVSTWADGANGGTGTMSNDVLTETGTPWSVVQPQAAWICAFVIKSNGFSSVASFLASNPTLNNNQAKYQWTSGMTTLVDTDLGQI